MGSVFALNCLCDKALQTLVLGCTEKKGVYSKKRIHLYRSKILFFIALYRIWI